MKLKLASTDILIWHRIFLCQYLFKNLYFGFFFDGSLPRE
jgi:hypothetical protein